MTKGYLVLETGETFEGRRIGAETEVEGEVVFNTSMTGYEDIMTDPSYAGQILTFTSPIIGNYGVPLMHQQERITTTGVIMNDHCNHPRHYQTSTSFAEKLKEVNIPGLIDVDTRALVQTLRTKVSTKGKIIKDKPTTSLQWKKQQTTELVDLVSVNKNETYGNGENHLVLIDFGYKKTLVQQLIDLNCRVTIVPYSTSVSVIQSFHPDGIVISNGPGNPEELRAIIPTIQSLTKMYPTIGIGLGHQLIAMSYGAKTKRLSVGHRGANHPVKNLLSGKVHITSQNHGYVVEDDSIDSSQFQTLFQHVNDKTIEGLKHKYLPILSVQFYPEGNKDTDYIFHRFMQQVIASRGSLYAKA